MSGPVQDTVDIGPATLRALRPDLVVVRFKPGGTADAKALRTSMEARRAHFPGARHGAMLVVPEGSGMAPSLLDGDHYRGTAAEDFTLALAVVCPDRSVRHVIELYFAMYGSPFPVMFFDLERDALAWLQARGEEAR